MSATTHKTEMSGLQLWPPLQPGRGDHGYAGELRPRPHLEKQAGASLPTPPPTMTSVGQAAPRPRYLTGVPPSS
jgi:hypothetical protein